MVAALLYWICALPVNKLLGVGAEVLRVVNQHEFVCREGRGAVVDNKVGDGGGREVHVFQLQCLSGKLHTSTRLRHQRRGGRQDTTMAAQQISSRDRLDGRASDHCDRAKSGIRPVKSVS